MFKKEIKKIKQFISKTNYLGSYLLLRSFGFPISLLSYKNIHKLGNFVGLLAYYLLRNFRKRVFNNLAIANKLQLSEKEKIQICKESFQNLAITSLEFFRLKRKPGQLSGITIPYNSDKTMELLSNSQGIIFLLGHLANWEIPFIETTKDYPGIAIGKPLKNPWINKWILSVRQMNKGKIVYPKNAISIGLREVKEGRFLGIVGDQALPESSYSYPFLGTRAWTSPTAALLAYKTNCPVIVGTIVRKNYQYQLHHSEPIWPDLSKPLKSEVTRMMDQCMAILEKGIMNHPGQWLWQHDRWKQSGIDHVKKKYRHGFILIVFSEIHLSLIPLFKQIYHRSFLTFFIPEHKKMEDQDPQEFFYYRNKNDLFIDDWRFQLLIDLTNTKGLDTHFKKRGSFETVNLLQMQKKAKKKEKLELLKQESLNSLIQFHLCK